ncbi:hypothetical protein ES705_50675 [subsurface metagenome]
MLRDYISNIITGGYLYGLGTKLSIPFEVFAYSSTYYLSLFGNKIS